VPLINGGTSFYGGFVIFSVIGYIAHKTGRKVTDFVQSGESLQFFFYSINKE
jgi:prolipoprotein diacylglyceryltransferase